MQQGRKLTFGISLCALILSSITPAMAAVSAHAQPQLTLAVAANDHRGWRDHDDGIDGGDILTGIGILTGIAVLADVLGGSGNHRERAPQSRNQDSYPQNYPSQNAPLQSESAAGNDVGSAVTLCSNAAERSAGGSARVQQINSVTRDGNGWRVEGALSGNGARGFTCAASGGQVDYVRMADGV